MGFEVNLYMNLDKSLNVYVDVNVHVSSIYIGGQ